jgi:hypothetical protein
MKFSEILVFKGLVNTYVLGAGSRLNGLWRIRNTLTSEYVDKWNRLFIQEVASLGNSNDKEGR